MAQLAHYWHTTGTPQSIAITTLYTTVPLVPLNLGKLEKKIIKNRQYRTYVSIYGIFIKF